jgi:hypothetical protein
VQRGKWLRLTAIDATMPQSKSRRRRRRCGLRDRREGVEYFLVKKRRWVRG